MPSPPELFGTDRYEVVRRLGSGGLGLVYEVLDRQRQIHVALKTFLPHDTTGLLRLKHEFRVLRDLQHPNLVALHELHADGTRCFFTMELVDGVDFLRWVRPPGGARDGDSGDASEPGPTVHVPRLRDALAQLAGAVHTLHRAGKLHRDLKPANVLVTAAGRVVLLDFGLAVELADHDPRVVGTVDYMAPEQAASRPIGPAADWYAVGTMLYQALTGDLPFRGAPLEVLARKRDKPPVAVHSINPRAPTDLAELAMRLLSRDGDDRPNGLDVLSSLSTPTPDPSTPLVGQQPYLDTLQLMLAEARQSGGCVLVHGDEGVGLSTLVQSFVASAKRRVPSLVVLAGRVHQREAVPYRGIDGVIDALAQHLRRRTPADAAKLLGSSTALPALFPVLRHRAEPSAPDVVKACQELRGVLARLADEAPLVMVIDDLQFADEQSLALLTAITTPPAPFLLVGTSSSGEANELAVRLDARLLSVDWSARLAALSDGAHRLLRHIAPVDPITPVTQAELAVLAGLDFKTLAVDLAVLARAGLVRLSGVRRTDTVQLICPRHLL